MVISIILLSFFIETNEDKGFESMDTLHCPLELTIHMHFTEEDLGESEISNIKAKNKIKI